MDTHKTIIVISSVQPQTRSAGGLVLHRHLDNLTYYSVKVIHHPYKPDTITCFSKILKRLQKSWLDRIGNDLDVIRYGQAWNKTLEGIRISDMTKQGKLIVLTVAHGDGCWAAQSFAAYHNFPLVVFFHDWWPDSPKLHKPFRNLLNRNLIKLYQGSSLALCVSQGMKEALGSHPNSRVLYPIPNFRTLLADQDIKQTSRSSSFLNVIYFGNLCEYGFMLGQLLKTIKEKSTIHFQVRGANPNWSAEFCSEMRSRGLWLDFVSREKLNEWSANADAFLVVMSFEPALRRRMETSFPSKLPEYAQFGKTLVIWGPEYCSAVRWAKGGDWGLCITDESSQSVVCALETLRNSSEKQRYYSGQAKKAAQKEFNPNYLQNSFLTSIEDLFR